MDEKEFDSLCDDIKNFFIEEQKEHLAAYNKLVSEGKISIENCFNLRFRNWDIKLPEGAFESEEKGMIRRGPSCINYIFGQDEKGKYIEYYTMNRFTNDSHERIYENGETLVLPAKHDIIIYGAGRTLEQAKEEFDRHNREVDESLEKAGLTDYCLCGNEFLDSLKRLPGRKE